MNYRWAIRAGFAWLLFTAACDTRKEPPPSAHERSPNASILPAPLASTTELLGAPKATASAVDTGLSAAGGAPQTRVEVRPVIPVPVPLSPLKALVDRDPRSKDPLLFTLEAEWRWPDMDLGPLEPEADLAAIEATRKASLPVVSIDISASGRLRWAWGTSAFALPAGSELRGRYDSYGHVLLWPNSSKYRVLGEGTLKAVLSERRADATPLVSGTIHTRPGKIRLGFASTVSELNLPSGETLLLDQIKLEELDLGAPLLCRLLVELIGVKPSSEACSAGMLPVYAEFHWAGGGGAIFEVKSLSKKTDVAPRSMLVPPPEADFEVSGLPETSGILVDPAEQRALHSRDRLIKQTESRGLIAANFGGEVAYLILDRVRVAWVAPARTVELVDLRPGRYHAAWHSFFGRPLGPPEVVEVPDRIVVGGKKEAPANDTR